MPSFNSENSPPEEPHTLQHETDSGKFSLIRPGADSQKSLQAWDAADSYLIDYYLSELSTVNVAVINDQFGALGIALRKTVSYWISDSFCSHSALKQNLAHNQLSVSYPLFDPLEPWDTQVKAGIALIKLPKNLSFLTHLINRCHSEGISNIYIAGMMKHLPKNILVFLQKFGEVNRLPFKKKATIYKLTLSPSLIESIRSNYPKQLHIGDIKLSTQANVFGRDKLDPGAAFVVENLTKLPKCNNVADLCCGSGILAIAYAKQNFNSSNAAKITLFDESFMAVQSSINSCELNSIKDYEVHWDDGLKNNKQKFDLILCNPPFHEEHTVGDYIAKRLFNDAKQHLTPNGSLVVVGNRHLGYHVTLKKYFKQVSTLASNSKFILLKANA
ncbi:MAG: 16S rRNA G1207 methylase RsmC [Crocinitomicaceae bacterium]|jgi:16S rRNA G1207 methylase RsmC